MGRMFYATPNQGEDNRVVHVITSELGTVVLAFRHPKVGEQAYAIGYDFTVRNAVKEILGDWGPSEPPGWRLDSTSVARSVDDTFLVTILAAYDASHPTVKDAIGRDDTDDDHLMAIATVEERDSGRWFMITEGEDDGYELPVDPLDFDLATNGARVSIRYRSGHGFARVVEVLKPRLPERDLMANERIAEVCDTAKGYQVVTTYPDCSKIQYYAVDARDRNRLTDGMRVVILLSDNSLARLVEVIP